MALQLSCALYSLWSVCVGGGGGKRGRKEGREGEREGREGRREGGKGGRERREGGREGGMVRGSEDGRREGEVRT